jgi:solute carrier family 35 protein E1
MTTTDRRWSSPPISPQITKFPDYEPQLSPLPREHDTIFEEVAEPHSNGIAVPPLDYGKTNGSARTDRWAAYREHSRMNGHAVGGRRGHGRQKSLSDAIRTINSRRGSVSANAQEIADALKAPVSYTLIVSLIGK